MGAAASLAVGRGAMAADPSHTLRFGTLLNPSTMDPHFAAVLGNLYTQCTVYACLTVLDSDAKGIDPGFAVKWRALDDHTWEFNLREGVRFHDGSRFAAQSVAYSFARIPTIQNSPNSFISNIKGIAAIEVVNDATLRMHTRTPLPDLPTALCRIMIIPDHVGEPLTAEQFDNGEAAIGIGAYRLKHFVRGELMQLERFDGYWGKPPPWPKVDIRSICVDAARTAALLSSNVDIIDNINIADLPSLRTRADTAMTTQQGARIMFAFLDQDRATSPFAAAPDGSNPLRDVRVRKALQVGVDRDAIIGHVLEGSGVAAGQMTIPGRFGASPNLKVPPHDPRQAKELLAAAGYDKGFSLTLHGTSDSYPAGDRVLQAIAQYYSRLGIKVSVVTETTSVAYARMNRRDFSLLFIGYGGEGFSSIYLTVLLHSKNPELGLGVLNQGGYSNPAVDKLIEQSLQEFDEDRRARQMEQAFETAIGEDQAVLTFYYPIENYASRRDVATYKPDAYGRLVPGRAIPA
jgi:peptide/nickel transport system substrate-binding protein